MASLKELGKAERDAHVDRSIDAAMAIGHDNKQPPALISFIDRVVRPGMKWINDMEASDANAEVVWQSMMSGMSNLIGEMTLRLNRRDDPMGGTELAQRMINQLAENLGQHIELNFHPPKSEQQ
jgi:hypothetical protein